MAEPGGKRKTRWILLVVLIAAVLALDVRLGVWHNDTMTSHSRSAMSAAPGEGIGRVDHLTLYVNEPKASFGAIRREVERRVKEADIVTAVTVVDTLPKADAVDVGSVLTVHVALDG